MSSGESSEAGTVARTGSWDVRRLGGLDPQGVWGPEVRLLELPLQISPLALPGSGLSAYRERESGRAETANQEDLRNACALWPPPRLRDLRRPTEGGHPATPPEFRLGRYTDLGCQTSCFACQNLGSKPIRPDSQTASSDTAEAARGQDALAPFHICLCGFICAIQDYATTWCNSGSAQR